MLKSENLVAYIRKYFLYIFLAEINAQMVYALLIVPYGVLEIIAANKNIGSLYVFYLDCR
jgi:hypothetical protein